MLPKNASKSRTPSLTYQQSYGNIKRLFSCKLLAFVVFDIKKKKLAASSMLHEAQVAYYAFDVAARFLILLFMPLLWLR